MNWFRKPQECPSGNPIARYLEILGNTYRTVRESEQQRVTPHPANARQERDNADAFMQRKSHLIEALRAHIHDSSLADRFGAPTKQVKTRGKAVFGITLAPLEIVIRSD